MKSALTLDVLSSFDSAYSTIFSLESILKLTKTACLDKEASSMYYNLSQINKLSLSEERNHYISMLDLALDQLANLKEQSKLMENLLTQLK